MIIACDIILFWHKIPILQCRGVFIQSWTPPVFSALRRLSSLICQGLAINWNSYFKILSCIYSEYCLKSVVMPLKEVPKVKPLTPRMCCAVCSNEVEKAKLLRVLNARGQLTGAWLVFPWMSLRELMVPTHACHVSKSCMSQRWLIWVIVSWPWRLK